MTLTTILELDVTESQVSKMADEISPVIEK
jgi:hypothetical protein